MSDLNLKPDRTEDDVKKGTAKGFYNFEDLNRVEAATAYIAQLLTNAGYPATVVTKTNWAITDFPSASEMKRYLGNVQKCVNQFCKMPSTPDLPPSMKGLTYIGANTIEQSLLDIEILLGYMTKVLRYSGTFYCGQMDSLRGYTL